MTVYMNGEVSTSNLAPAMTLGICDISSGAVIGDSIEYMKDYIKIWVPRCWAYTDESLRGTEGAKFIDTPEQVEMFGDYASVSMSLWKPEAMKLGGTGQVPPLSHMRRSMLIHSVFCRESLAGRCRNTT